MLDQHRLRSTIHSQPVAMRFDRALPEPKPEYPPKVTVAQWSLGVFSLALAASDYLFTSNEGFAFLPLTLLLANVLMTGSAAKEMIQTRFAGKFLLLASTFVFFWLEAFVMSRQSDPFTVPDGLPILAKQFDYSHVQLAYLYVALFQLMLLVGFSVRLPMKRVVTWVKARNDVRARWANILRYSLGACALAPLLISYGLDMDTTVDALIASRTAPRSELESGTLMTNLQYLGTFGASLLFIEAILFRTTGRVQRLLLGVCFSLPFVLGGARHILVFITLPLLVTALARFRNKHNKRRVLLGFAGVILVLLIAQLQLVFRSVGWNEIRNITSSQVVEIEPSSLSQFTSLLFAIHLVPATHDYFMEPAEHYFIFHWIPRRFWPDKPVMQAWRYYDDVYTQGVTGFNVTPSIIGQFHMNWGLPGVLFIGLWLGFLTFLIDRLFLALDLERQRAMAVVLGMSYAFIVSCFRMYSPYYFTYVLFGIFGMLCLTYRRRAPQGARLYAPAVLRNPGLS